MPYELEPLLSSDVSSVLALVSPPDNASVHQYRPYANGSGFSSDRSGRGPCTSDLTEKVVEISVPPWLKAEDVGVVRADFMQSLLAATQIPR